jgi:hypothetical protein
MPARITAWAREWARPFGRAAATFSAAALLAWAGWNSGPSRHLGLPPVGPKEALGYAALACLVRYAVGAGPRSH